MQILQVDYKILSFKLAKHTSD